MRTLLVFSLLLWLSLPAWATHLLGGYIQTKAISGLQYEITVILYADEINGRQASDQQDQITVCFGDGVSRPVVRQSRVFINERQSSLNTYRVVYTYAGPGTYRVTASIPNRTPTLNSRRGGNWPFVITNTFLAGSNQTPAFLTWPNVLVKTNQVATLPLRATDADGDSLVYQLAWPLVSLGTDACQIADADGYQYPNEVSRRGTFRLNNRTGDLTWNAPTVEGRYNVAIRLSEYRRGNLISQTIHEFTLTVVDQPGSFEPIPPYEPASAERIITATETYRDGDMLLNTFPNPTENQLHVLFQSTHPTTPHLTLADLNGRSLYQYQFPQKALQHEQRINIGNLPSGTYVLRADVDGQVLTRKIVRK